MLFNSAPKNIFLTWPKRQGLMPMSEKGTSNLVQMTSNQVDKSPTRSAMLQCNESNMLNFKEKVTDGRIPNGKSKEDDK